MNHSPLRYPGGKSKITPLINMIIEKTGKRSSTYIEPFAGGAGVAVSLLLEGNVDEIVINDKDKAVYSFWRAILDETNAFLKKLRETPISIAEWRKQKEIYQSCSKYSLELGFAAFFLNRTNRSGILSTAGPIGGYEQKGEWKLSARFNKDDLANRISSIARLRRHIKVFNKDVLSFIENYIPRFPRNSFVYFDPPYYNKGKVLYHNSFVHSDHVVLAQKITNCVKCPWVITYDNVPEITTIYEGYIAKQFDIDYSLSARRVGTEVMIFKDHSYLPSPSELRKCKYRLF